MSEVRDHRSSPQFVERQPIVAVYTRRSFATAPTGRTPGYTPRPVQPSQRTTVTARPVAHTEPAAALPKLPPIVPVITALPVVEAPIDPWTTTPVLAPAKRELALLLPGHNEELIVAYTIQSAVAAGQPIESIYVVNDASTDRTEEIARELLGDANVLTVSRSGKALAVQKAVQHFDMENRYVWLHIADADSVFSPNYFREYYKKLDASKYAVAVGFVQSLKGNWISTYRALTYSYSQHVNRRIQAKLGMISVFPGPITCFRMDIWKELELDGASLTEDFDITLQVHRKKLGKIVFIPKAVNYTQDPQTLKDFCKQNMRWQRGFFQGVKKYKIGLHGQKIDASLGFQMGQALLFVLQISILLPYIIYVTGNWMIIPVAIAADYIINSLIAVWASVAIRRWNMLGSIPYFYFLRWLEIGIYFIAFFEVMVMGKFKDEVKGWGTEGRRYEISGAALQEAASA